jgi:hypothetical protein
MGKAKGKDKEMKTFFQIRKELNEGLVDKAKDLVKKKLSHHELSKNLKASIDAHQREHKKQRELELRAHAKEEGGKDHVFHASRGDVHKDMAKHAQDALNAHKKNDHSGVKKHMIKYRDRTKYFAKRSRQGAEPAGQKAHPSFSHGEGKDKGHIGKSISATERHYGSFD